MLNYLAVWYRLENSCKALAQKPQRSNNCVVSIWCGKCQTYRGNISSITFYFKDSKVGHTQIRHRALEYCPGNGIYPNREQYNDYKVRRWRLLASAARPWSGATGTARGRCRWLESIPFHFLRDADFSASNFATVAGLPHARKARRTADLVVNCPLDE